MQYNIGGFCKTWGLLVLFSSVLLAQEEKPTGNLGITSTPQEVSIWLDGVCFGYRTPHLIEGLSVGLHKLILAKQDFKTWRDTVRITADTITSIEVSLEPIQAKKKEVFVPHDLPRFYDLDHENITLDLSPYRTSRVASWELSILDMYGNVFRTLKGKRSPPAAVKWDGKGNDSLMMTVGDVYTFIFALYMKGGSTLRRVGADVIDINGLTYDNVIIFKGAEIDFYGMIAPPVVTRYYDYVIKRFEAEGYSRITIRAPSVAFAKPVTQYLAIDLPYAKVIIQRDSTLARVEFILD